MADNTFTPGRIVQSRRGVAVLTVKTADLQLVLVCLSMPVITGGIFVEPVCRMKPRSIGVTALAVVGDGRTGYRGDPPVQIVPMTRHAERFI
jgi:hypothetical protein